MEPEVIKLPDGSRRIFVETPTVFDMVQKPEKSGDEPKSKKVSGDRT